MRKGLSIFGMIFLIVSSAVFDQNYNKLETIFSPRSQFFNLFWYEIIGYVVLAIMLFSLAWYVLYFNSRSFLVSITYIIIGMFTLFSMTLLGYYKFWSPILQNSQFFRSWFVECISSPISLTSYCAVTIMTIGLARLMPNKVLWKK